MTKQDLHDEVGSDPEADVEAKWQRHAMAGLWVLLGVLLAITLVVLYGEAHGFFHSAAAHSNPAPAWPDAP